MVCGVNFSIMRDKESGVHSVFFQEKGTKVIDKAFKNVLGNIEKKRLKNRFIKILRSLKRWLKIAFQKTRSKTNKRNKSYD